MKEHQHQEWKEVWRDEHLKWISAFANADGGVLTIGRNDAGEMNRVGLMAAGQVLQQATQPSATLVKIQGGTP